MSNSVVCKTHRKDFGLGVAEWHSAIQASEDGVDKERLFFLAANAQPASSYSFFLKRLAHYYDTYAFEHRAIWSDRASPKTSIRWRHFLNDYKLFLRYQQVKKGELIHVGHSFGASLGLNLALEKPQLFKRLVLVEPGTTNSLMTALPYRAMPFAVRKKLPYMVRAGKRRAVFSSKEEFMAEMWTKEPYKNFSNEAMLAYANGGLIEDNGLYRLKFPSAWEQHIYCDVYFMPPRIKQLKVPTLLLLAENSEFLKPHVLTELKRSCEKNAPHIQIKILKGVSHLAIQDNPDLVTESIVDWLAA